jgi:peptidoglycan/xylan/chitin deacetylase (PgdA/CDA1 family)
VIAETLALGVTAGAGLLCLGTFHPRFALFGPLVWHGRRDRNRVALSFDDGPHPEFTPQIAAALKTAGARATFFCVGEHLDAHPDVARALLADGHELANHTYSHDMARDLFSTSRLQRDLDRCRASLAKLGAPSSLYRPAVGIHSPPVHAAARALGLTVVTWSDAARDGAWHLTEAEAQRLAAAAKPGDILALHDGVLHDGNRERRASTVQHLPTLLNALKARGLEMTTVSGVLTDT